MPEEPLPTPPTLQDSAALIVGGTAGIGLATARALARDGVQRICIVGRNAERGEAARAALQAETAADVRYIQGNPIEADSATAIAGSAIDALGRIDILVNTTAPEVTPEIFTRIPIDDIARILTHFVLPSMHMCHAVLPAMVERRSGVIVNVASDAGKTATPGEAVIGGSKAAIIMFTRTLAIENKRFGIRANVITPSLVHDTPTGQKVMAGGFSTKLFQKAAEAAKLGVPTADDQAELIAFLASPGAARLTGQAISLNGGISAA